ncbi:hypothetical protein DFQ30_003112 [Apophysomyces sp. BC1015]|nr:hypothetical protein DFQ30_003112 [Apophysomyces sp. BC1015]KAG0179499.1 hypothetical protein DFQ29_002043 [Apophysomyces sp. BC1021]
MDEHSKLAIAVNVSISGSYTFELNIRFSDTKGRRQTKGVHDRFGNDGFAFLYSENERGQRDPKAQTRESTVQDFETQHHSETEIWAMFADPVLRSIFSRPEELVHLRCTISVVSQLYWGRSWGFGEAKNYEPTDNNHSLAWDLVRVAMFNKALINREDHRWFRLTYYVMELNFRGIYSMLEIGQVELPRSVEEADRLMSIKSLRDLTRVAHCFD